MRFQMPLTPGHHVLKLDTIFIRKFRLRLDVARQCATFIQYKCFYISLLVLPFDKRARSDNAFVPRPIDEGLMGLVQK